MEVKSFGIDVIIIEPGGTDTNWQQITNEHLLRATPKSSPYRSMAERVVKTTIKGMSTADELGQLMLKVTTIKKPKSRYQVKFIDKLMVIAARKFSYHIMDQIIGISQRILTN